MIKHVSLSANENPLYLFYLPLTCWAWNKFGWQPYVILVKEKHPSKNELIFDFVEKSIPCRKSCDYINTDNLIYKGYETATIAQLSRLYAAINIEASDYLITGDSDMIPLSDYWKVTEDGYVSIWGWNLTNFEHIPICYVGMKKHFWFRTLEISIDELGRGIESFIEYDLIKNPNAKSDDKQKKWVVDQDILTYRIKKQWNENHLRINPRGILSNGYPVGRIDRSAWTLQHDTYIDCHAPHDILTNRDSQYKLLSMLKHIWPNEDFTWWESYQFNFIELLKTIPQ